MFRETPMFRGKLTGFPHTHFLYNETGTYSFDFNCIYLFFSKYLFIIEAGFISGVYFRCISPKTKILLSRNFNFLKYSSFLTPQNKPYYTGVQWEFRLNHKSSTDIKF